MVKLPNCLLSCVLAASLSCTLAPAVAIAQEGIDQSASTLAAQSERKEQSWRYQGGENVSASEGVELLSADFAWSETDQGFLSSDGSIIQGAIRKGVDVSEHQGWIDWEAVKASGVDFAIIRCGYGNDWESQDDKFWECNVSECERLGIPYGVYIYSYAENLTMAQSETDHVLRLLEGHSPSYPVYYDLEESSMASAENASLLADMTSLFCAQIQAAGYTPGVYANLNWWNNYLTDPAFDQWDRWVAQYNSSCWYEGEYGLWQATSSGSVAGVEGNVDVNFEMAGYTKDVSEDDWFVQSGAYYYVSSKGIINGYGNRTFGPNDAITRGQVATILWRMAGSPTADADDFLDVDYSQYYGAAVEWARETGVIHGYELEGVGVVFDAERTITREELAVMIANYASVCGGIESSGNALALSSKPDAQSVSSWALGSMAWAVESGIINGVMVDGTAYLMPGSTATRAEMAQMITTYCTQVS